MKIDLFKTKIFKNSSWIIGGKIAQMIIGFFVGILTARYLGPSNYGLINVATSYSAFVIPICTLGFNAIFVKCVIDHRDKEGVYLGTGIALRCITSTVAMVVMLFVVTFINPDDKELHLVFFLHSFVLLFQAFDLFEYWYQSRYLSKYPAIFGLIAYTGMAGYRIFLLATNKSVEWFAVATVLDHAIIAVIYMVYTVPKYKLHLCFSLPVGREMFHTSKHFIISNIMVVIYAQMDKVMIGKMLSNADVGLYSVGVGISGLWTFILIAIINSFRPSIVEAYNVNRKKYKKQLVSLYSIIIWTSIFVSLGICLFAKWMILLLYGKEYIGAISALRIVTWYTGFSYLGVARNIWTVCEEKQRYEKFFAFSGVVANLLLNFMLIPVLGINGAAIASLSTQIVTNVLVPLCNKNTRENSIHILKAFNPKNILLLFK